MPNLAAAFFALCASTAAHATGLCDPTVAIISNIDGRNIARFNIEVADDDAERAQGLMYRNSLSSSAGMLFVYPDARNVAFWMRNTLIPLDIIFFDERGQFVSVQKKAKPLDETPLPSAGPAQFVLEINGGMAAKLGIGQGSVLSHPTISQLDAILPCAE